MSRPKLIRALLATASLLGAIPLMAQTSTSATAVVSVSSGFPYGRYMIRADSAAHQGQGGDGLILEFTENSLKVFNGADLIETHGTMLAGDTWAIFAISGDCLDTGSYHWKLVNGVLTFTLVEDNCAERAQAISTVRLVRQ